MSLLSDFAATRPGPNRPSLLFAGIQAMLRAWSQTRKREADIASLRALDDHTLKDIGLHRSEIASVVYGRGLDPSRRRRGPWRWIRLL